MWDFSETQFLQELWTPWNCMPDFMCICKNIFLQKKTDGFHEVLWVISKKEEVNNHWFWKHGQNPLIPGISWKLFSSDRNFKGVFSYASLTFKKKTEGSIYKNPIKAISGIFSVLVVWLVVNRNLLQCNNIGLKFGPWKFMGRMHASDYIRLFGDIRKKKNKKDNSRPYQFLKISFFQYKHSTYTHT